MERLKWIDLLRGFCMIAILWFHTEMYYVGFDKTPYAFYVGDVLAVFFIISGYLFYQADTNKRLKSILRYILLPYFIFTSVIAIAKYFVYQDRNIGSLVIDIISGHASWFIAALIVSQLIFIFFLRITKEKIIYLSILSILCLVLSYFVGNSYHPSPLYYQQNLWHFNESLLGCFLLYIGYSYHKYEAIFNRINTITYRFILLIIVCIIKYYMIYYDNMQFIFGPIIVSNYFLFIIDLLLTSLLLIHLFKRLPSVKMIEWTGSHSIAYYFICGGVPMIISNILYQMNMISQSYLSILCVFIMVYAVSTGITWLIYRYTPIFRK